MEMYRPIDTKIIDNLRALIDSGKEENLEMAMYLSVNLPPEWRWLHTYCSGRVSSMQPYDQPITDKKCAYQASVFMYEMMHATTCEKRLDLVNSCHNYLAMFYKSRFINDVYGVYMEVMRPLWDMYSSSSRDDYHAEYPHRSAFYDYCNVIFDKGKPKREKIGLYDPTGKDAEAADKMASRIREPWNW